MREPLSNNMNLAQPWEGEAPAEPELRAPYSGSASASHSHWLLGTTISFAGVALVRLLGDQHYLLRALGFALAGLGLLIIAIGIRNRINQTHDN